MNKKILACALCLALCVGLTGFAQAETTFDGTVVSSESVGVTAPFGGTVSSFRLREGDELKTGDVIAQVETTKVYAPADGTVTGVFGSPGDAVDDVATRLGAVLYIEPTGKYSISASIDHAYSASDNKYVNIGETVYLKSYNTGNGNTAVGAITAVKDTAYTVETTSGELLMGETVSIYRDPDYTTTSRIGRGTVSRTAEVAVNGGSGGSILYMHVKKGDTVTRGQLLYETVTGTLDGLYATSNQIVSDVEGIVASVNVASGSTVNKGDTLLTVYPHDQMQVVIEIDEYDLADIHEGDAVNLEFNYDDTDESATPGTVAMISHVSETSGTSDVAYKAYIDFAPSDAIRLGMTVRVTPVGSGAEEATAAQADTVNPTDTQAAPEASATPEPSTDAVQEAAAE